MNYKLMTGLLVLFALCNCSKNYNCVCVDPGGTQTVASYHTTKKKATDLCNTYYNDHYGSGWTEAGCRIK